MSVTDVNCTLFENNSILVKIHTSFGGYTFSYLEHVGRNILREAIICHIIAMNAYPIVDNMVVQIFEGMGDDFYHNFRESRSTINGISETDLAQRPELLDDDFNGLVQKMIGTRVSWR